MSEFEDLVKNTPEKIYYVEQVEDGCDSKVSMILSGIR